MKQLIHTIADSNGVYELYAELVDQLRPEGVKQLRFTKSWTPANGTVQEEKAGEFFLDQNSLQNLTTLLQS